MTYREKLAIDRPECVDPEFGGGCMGCPYEYGYEKRSTRGGNCPDPYLSCYDCWNREIPETTNENKKENDTMPIHAVREMTATELLQKAKEYQQQAELMKVKEQMREAGGEIKAAMDGLVEAGFTEDQAFAFLLSAATSLFNKL